MAGAFFIKIWKHISYSNYIEGRIQYVIDNQMIWLCVNFCIFLRNVKGQRFVTNFLKGEMFYSMAFTPTIFCLNYYF